MYLDVSDSLEARFSARRRSQSVLKRHDQRRYSAYRLVSYDCDAMPFKLFTLRVKSKERRRVVLAFA